MAEARHLNDDDVQSFLDASGKQARPTLTRKERKNVIDQLAKHYPFRIRSLRRDLKWLRKRLHRMGVDPEEARWMLW